MNYYIDLMWLFLIINGTAHAGWTSGGGQIFRDSQNPWFLENTKVVTYCIDIDEAHFGVSKPDASREVKDAIAEWLDALERSRYDDFDRYGRKFEDEYYEKGDLVPFGQLRIGTQEFIEVDCSGEVDLRFQLGILTPEQKTYFGNFREHVGVAVRTNYRRDILKGQGFIYLSPVSGPLVSLHPNMAPNAWMFGDYIAFRLVLRHELGHVFGVGHREDSVMDEKFPELIVDKRFANDQETNSNLLQNFRRRSSVREFFELDVNTFYEGCHSSSAIVALWLFVKDPVDTACSRVEITKKSLIVKYKVRPDDEYEIVAKGKLESREMSSSPEISVYLPEEQQVFTRLPEEVRSYGRIFGQSRITQTLVNGKLKIYMNGEKLPIQLIKSLNRFSVTAIEKGKFHSDVLFLY